MSATRRPAARGAATSIQPVEPQVTPKEGVGEGASESRGVVHTRVILLALLLGGAILWQLLSSDPAQDHSPTAGQGLRAAPRGFTIDELAKYTGEHDTPIYLSILGQVFDVTSGRRHYGGDSDYSVFAGRDASRSFITGEFEGEGVQSDVAGLAPPEMKGLLEWRSFYHETYIFKGYLLGSHYYDESGAPMPLLAEVQRGADEADRLEAIRKANQKKHPPCSMKWTAAEGGRVWCAEGYPRLLTEYVDGGLPKDTSERKSTQRCACFDSVGWSDMRKVYRGCKPDAQSCAVLPDNGDKA